MPDDSFRQSVIVATDASQRPQAPFLQKRAPIGPYEKPKVAGRTVLALAGITCRCEIPGNTSALALGCDSTLANRAIEDEY